MAIMITVDIVLFSVINDVLNILLIQRKFEPFKGIWAIPGGFVKEKESLEQAAKRELKEEVGISDVYLEQLYTFGNPKRDPRGRIISVAYFGLVNSDKIRLKSSTDAKLAKWFSITNLPKLGFDHKQILESAVQRLRNKLVYTTAGFQLLPNQFTLTELQKLYEIILEKKFDKRNFRKKIFSLNILSKTKETKMQGAHRPAKLYRFKFKHLTFSKEIV